MEENVLEVIYETRYHATRPFTSNYPPLQRNEGSAWTFLSLRSIRGVSQLKEKWTQYWHPRRLKRSISLFISPRGVYVAVAAGNVITILQKEDDYQKPCGVFRNTTAVSFSCGSWSEAHDILGVVDDMDTIYFIKTNGEQITRITNRDLKVSFSIVGLIAQVDSDTQRSYLCSFTILTSDGALHCIEVSQDPRASIFSSDTLNNKITVKGQFPKNVFCFDYHPELALIVVVGSAFNNSLMPSGNSGSCCLSIWRQGSNLSLELAFYAQFEGLYSNTKDYMSQITYPKVLISPKGNFVGTLDLNGYLAIFKVGKEVCSLSAFSVPESPLTDIDDFTWWSDSILTLAKRCGTVIMFDILRCEKLLENDLAHSTPVLERVQQSQGHLFLLENTLSKEVCNQLGNAGLIWSLVSFSERSVREMFKILISNQKYQGALEFANRHNLDKDDVLKVQWLQSQQGINEINIFLSKIKDQSFILSECIDKVGPKEEDVKALLAYGLQITNQYDFSVTEDRECKKIWDYRITRLQLLQFRDRLDTYFGINMGRFSMQEYRKFRVMPINEVAITLAESGKIGALNLLFKRHPYSLSPFMLEVLAAVPETIPVKSYAQLLPGRSPHTNVVIRENDWVECEDTVSFINSLSENHEDNSQIRTEPIVKQWLGYYWPSIDHLSIWYKNRATDIDSLSGQLDNCLCLVDFACQKGIHELRQFHEDISYLNDLIYSDDLNGETSSNLSLREWAQLTDYEKFRMMLKGVNEKNVVERLCDKAIQFMLTRVDVTESFMVKWLKEIASENKLDICLMVIEEGCRDSLSRGIFGSMFEAVECSLKCIYLFTVTDRWNIMASILSKLPQSHDTERLVDEVIEKLKLAEGHIEAGRLLAFYQVPKPIEFFLEAHADSKGVKQILRLILSKFSRRQPIRSDNDWVNMWRDIQLLREKAFPFLDLEYMLMEFCRGLLKAGKFSLARNYLKGTGSVTLEPEKAEKLVIQAGREYFFSASSLACLEIWKAKECLNLFPNSRNVKAETDIIDALTVRLPNLGVTILPLQFRQITDPMEIIKMAVTSQPGAYLHVDEHIEIARLLGLTAQDQIAAVEEAIAREAAAVNDLQLTFDLCLVLAKKGHGLVWDLCAAIARGLAFENMDISSRKQLLGFALSHCDNESIGELLNVWKDLDMQGQCETLLGQDSMQDRDQAMDDFDEEIPFDKIKSVLSDVALELLVENESDWDSFIRKNRKIISFATLQLPRLLELSRKSENDDKVISGAIPGKQYVGVRMQAVVTILCWLARNGLAPKDNLVASLAEFIIEPPVTKEEGILGCSFLLNLLDAFNGVEIIEDQLKARHDYQDICSIMNVGMTYSLLNNSRVECEGPSQRRELLIKMFKEKHAELKSDEIGRIESEQSSFWREWKLKLEEQKHIADHSRVLKQIIPGVEVARFFSGDLSYIENLIFSLIHSVKFEKKSILMDVLKLADTYGLNHTKLLQQYLGSVLSSEVWTEEDITAEISQVKEELTVCAAITVKTVYLVVYPTVDGRNKPRLAYIYGLLSDCYSQLKGTHETLSLICPEEISISIPELGHFYEILEQECGRVSFIKNLNFKSVAGLGGLNLESFSTEVYNHIDKDSLEALAEMVHMLVSIYTDRVPNGLILRNDVYRYYIQSLLNTFEGTARPKNNDENLMGVINLLEHTYDLCRKYIRGMSESEASDIMKQFFTLLIPFYSENLPDTSEWQNSLIMLLSFWIRLTDDMQNISYQSSEETLKLDCFMRCLKILIKLVTEDNLSPRQGWGTLFGYLNYLLIGDIENHIFNFCRSMIFSGCGFKAIVDVYTEGVSVCPILTSCTKGKIVDLYLNILDTILQDITSGSPVHQSLYQLLSTLSELEDDFENLKNVRHAVWERMIAFSDNSNLPNQVRVSALELMQFISGRYRTASFSELQKKVIPWEGWDESWCTSNVNERAAKNTLLALRSSHLVATISPMINISTDDLLNVETSVSCFSRLCETATTEAHCDVLIAILEEWEGVFVVKTDEEVSTEKTDAENNWDDDDVDDWDKGWENFQDEDPPVERDKKGRFFEIHPLHTCWLEIIQKIVALSQFGKVIKIIDKSLSKSNGLLLDADDLQVLIHIVVDLDCFSAMKIVLLFPYEVIQFKCLDAVEEKLKQHGISDTLGRDIEMFILVLSSGVTKNILTNSCYGTVLSYLCYLVGNFSRLLNKGTFENEDNTQDLLLFRCIVFPWFISELVTVDQQILAGFFVTKFMHTNPSLSLINVAEASLNQYLKRQLQDDNYTLANTSSSGTLGNTISSLRGKLDKVIQSTLSSLSNTNVA